MRKCFVACKRSWSRQPSDKIEELAAWNPAGDCRQEAERIEALNPDYVSFEFTNTYL